MAGSNDRTRLIAAVEAFVAARASDAAPDVDAYCREHAELMPELRARIDDVLYVEGAMRRTEAAAAPAAASPAIGDFRILRELGRGGMGVVYEAEQLSLRRRVALKVLSAHLTLRPEAVERFRREASTVARLRHPGIVQVFAVGEDAGTHWFAMELVEATPLDQVIAQLRERGSRPVLASQLEDVVERPTIRPLGAPEVAPRSPASGRRTFVEVACRLVAEVADALAYAHEAGVVHRDVKPSNVLLRPDGSPVLTDFGLAREEGLPSVTRTGEFAGTAYYLAPEQATPRRHVDPKADVYSLGVTLFELLTLRRPFEGDSSAEVLSRALSREPPSPRRFNPFLPPDLATIVLKAIERDPARRYASAAALASDLRAFLEFRPIAARPAGLPTRIGKLARRHRPATTSFAAASVVAVALGLWWWKRPGVLEVSTPTAGAAIVIDGADRGPVAAGEWSRFELAPGLHRVQLRKDEAELSTPEELVSLSRGAVTRFDRVLASPFGAVRFESEPAGARVALVRADAGSEPLAGETPFTARVRGGAYRARFEHPVFPAREERLEVAPGGAITVCATRWPTGELQLDSSQAGAHVEVYAGSAIAGRPLREAALPLAEPLRLPPGIYALRATLRDHDRADLAGARSLRVAEGRTTRATLWLPPFEHLLETRIEEPIAALESADLDGDGRAEIVAASAFESIFVFGSTGERLRRWETFTGGPKRIAFADVDGDGSLDAVVAAGGGFTIASLEKGAWLQEEIPDGRGASMANVVVEDFDGDGRVDVAVVSEGGDCRLLRDAATNRGLNRVVPRIGSLAGMRPAAGEAARLAFGLEDGAFGTMELDRLKMIPRGRVDGPVRVVAAADLEGAGRMDLVAGSTRGSLRAVDLEGRTLVEAHVDGAVRRLVPLDLDGDGRAEVAVATESGELSLLRAGGATTLEPSRSSPIVGVLAADLDGRGRRALCAAWADGRVGAWSADGARRLLVDVRHAAQQLVAADLDGDGRAELIVSTPREPCFVIASDGSIRSELWAGASAGVGQMLATDLDGDGRPEVLVGSIGWLRAFTLPSATCREVALPGEWFDNVVAADLDGDGRSEIACGGSRGELHAIESDGSLRFSARMGGKIFRLEAAALDGDGRRTLLAGDATGALVAWSPEGAEVARHVLDGPVITMAVVPSGGDGGESALAIGGHEALVVGAGARRVASIRFGGAPLKPTAVRGASGGAFVLGSATGELRVVGGSGVALLETKLDGPLSAVAGGDLRGEGAIDAVAGTMSGHVIAVGPDGGRLWSSQIPDQASVTDLACADLDGDGKADCVASTAGADLAAFRGDGAPLFATRLSGRSGIVSFADLDRDGRLEILTATGEGEEVAAIHADGSFLFAAGVSGWMAPVVVADLDADGTPEVTAAGFQGELVVLGADGDRRARFHRLG
ncbi:MAG TPA: FG-GAP-like repeat-containing protein, partial [Planctomycetota bacterium]|nr:FG-GAP-like repeat-containing protein [Planctomycetota bacterium]